MAGGLLVSQQTKAQKLFHVPPSLQPILCLKQESANDEKKQETSPTGDVKRDVR